MVEGAHGNHDADRLEARKREALERSAGQAHGDLDTGLGSQPLDAQAHAVDGPAHLDPRVEERLAAFARGLDRQLLGARLHELDGLFEDSEALDRLEPRIAVLIEAVSDSQRRLDGGRVGGVDHSDRGTIIGRAHLERRPAAGRLCVQEWKMLCHLAATPLAGQRRSGVQA